METAGGRAAELAGGRWTAGSRRKSGGTARQPGKGGTIRRNWKTDGRATERSGTSGAAR